MKRIFGNPSRIFFCLTAITAVGVFQTIGIAAAIANNTPQTVPFSQNWTNVGLIAADDDWSNVPGIIGYRGDDLVTATGADPRNILADGSATPVDVIANQTNPNAVATGGVAEFEIANPTVALQGSGTADAPHLVIHLNTTGQNNIRVSYNARDIDGSSDNAVQQIATQYRVGGTGDYINLPGGYVADATTGPNEATLVTPVSVVLPPAANNQSLVQVRIITTNAAGNDEWVGIDDISVTAGNAVAPSTANVDFNGDGRSDWVVTRGTVITGGGAAPQDWFINFNGSNATAVARFGASGDFNTPEDFDGDGRDDIAVWRPGAPFSAAFYILQSSNNTVRVEIFGQTGDNPRVAGDYDGDGKADPAVYRAAAQGQQGFFFYRGSLNNPNGNITYVPWGTGAVRPVAGDFDGDGKYDFCLHRNFNGAGQFVLLRSSNSAVEYIDWGLPTDALVPGDFDGDGLDDFCVVRQEGGQFAWYILERDGGSTGASPIIWGLTTDRLAPGDYDGDGRQDVAVWRENADPAQNYFYVRRSSGNSLQVMEWGQQGDTPAAGWYVQP